MVENAMNNKRGKPQEWTDEQLKELAIEVKYNSQSRLLTPSFLQKETGVGRNTWSRRMKDFIAELNQPVLSNISITKDNEFTLPNFDLIFKKYGNNESLLKNELLNVEVLIYELYNELKKYREKEEQYKKAFTEIKKLKAEISQQKKRAEHYEQLYNTVTISSIFPHLQGESGSEVHKLNIKDNLLNFNKDKDKNADLKDLFSHFPNISDKSIIKKEEMKLQSKKEKNMKSLINKFDI
ncbi:hypothetical protein ACW5UC_07930 [Priestia aryabhattai]|uniref:hypothetical protein n=1 Tax=Priestia megaterium TaxID=1404 RepID=UPI003F973449